MEKEQTVVILGLGAAGLFLTRQLSKITSKIYAIGRTDDVGMFSKYIEKQRRYYADNSDSIRELLVRIGDENKQKPHLYISSDQYLTLLLESKFDWTEYAVLEGADFKTLQIINDKEQVMQYCRRKSICIPESVSLSEVGERSDLQFPVVVKWNEKKLNMRKNPVGKIKVCKSRNDLEVLLREMEHSKIDKSLFHVQTYIEGDNSCQISAGGFYNEGSLLAGVVVNQSRQYPQGISACVFTQKGKYAEEIQQIALEFASDLSYSGFLEMEFKVDKKTGKCFLLDINPRPWGWVSALGSAYKDFYRVLEGKRPETKEKAVIWKSNLRMLMSGKNQNNAKLGKEEKGYEKAFDIYDPFDKKPGYMLYLLMVLKIIKRL